MQSGQIGRPQEDGRPLVERQGPPAGRRGHRGLDGALRFRMRGVGIGPQHLSMPVRRDDIVPLADARPVFATDDQRNIDGFGGDLSELGNQQFPLATARCVGVHRLIAGGGDNRDSVHKPG